MLSKIYILVTILTSSLIFSQDNTANSSYEKKPHPAEPQASEETSIPKGNYLSGIKLHLTELEQSIAQKIANIEKLHSRAAELSKRYKDKIYIFDEVPNQAIYRSMSVVSSRTIEFTFNSSKTKELKIVSQKKNIRHDLHSVIRTLTFIPGDIASIKIKLDRFDSRVKGISEIAMYNNMPLEAKLVTLKSIDQVLYNTIFKFDELIQREEKNLLENLRDNVSEM